MSRNKTSAGILPYRWFDGQFEVLLAHPGGPFWAKKDLGAWSIVKGEHGEDEEPIDAARREFLEETGWTVEGQLIPLSAVMQQGGKLVRAWGWQADLNIETFVGGTFSMEWPPRSGRQQEFPEVDRVAWFSLIEARARILKSQLPVIEELNQLLTRAAPLGF